MGKKIAQPFALTKRNKRALLFGILNGADAGREFTLTLLTPKRMSGEYPASCYIRLALGPPLQDIYPYKGLYKEVRKALGGS